MELAVATEIKEFSALPVGRAPLPVEAPHFPDALHAVVWRNWDVIDAGVLAEMLHASPEQIQEVAFSMGLPPQREILTEELRRNYMTIIRRNWHLLPYEQLCHLLDWDAAQMQFALNEDDFMWQKLGGYKPFCPPVHYAAPDNATQARTREIRRIMQEEAGASLFEAAEPPFGFIKRFDNAIGTATPDPADEASAAGTFDIRMVYPYFLRFGDPLLGEGINDVPEGYLAELASTGINAIWIQGVLNKLAPWELAPGLADGWEERLANLNHLVERCRKHGIDVLLYLNEPRAMPRAFFDEHPELRGVEETPARAPYSPDTVALCVSTQPVQDFLVNAVRHVFEQVPDLGGIFTITFSENLTNCYSREYDGDATADFTLRSNDDDADEAPCRELKPCPRCAPRGPEAVNADVCTLLERGMRLAGSEGKFLLYVWSTPEAWLPKMVPLLPKSTYFLCISEWGKTFTRGDYTGKVNEYSISIVGPSEQSVRQWELAQRYGLKTAAKMQAANTFEVSSIPYIPAMRRVAQHLSNVAQAGVNGAMLGWTNGGSPSPNLELVAEFTRSPLPSVDEALLNVAKRRFGETAAPGVVRAWDALSAAYGEFPFDIAVCYNGPQSHGPSNLLFAKPTGFVAGMCTFPFDDLDGWRGPYSEATFQNQFEKLAETWLEGVEMLDGLRREHPSDNLDDEWRIARALWIHFRSTANQIRFIRVRETDAAAAAEILRDEIELSRELMHLVAQDSRIGFEATNQYGYIRLDLAEKILNCRQLLAEMA